MGLRNRHLFKDELCFFITTTCYKWIPLFNTEARKLIISDSLNFISKKYHIAILGYVIMPNHLHAIFMFKDKNYLSDAMRDFKKYTSTQIRKNIESSQEAGLLKVIRVDDKQIFKVWQERFDDVCITDIRLLEIKLNYIHLNPLQSHWNLVEVPEDYLYSSAGFYYKNAPSRVIVEDYRLYF